MGWVLPPPPHVPDPYPAGTAPVSYRAYSYLTPAADTRSGRLLGGAWFACLVAVDGSRRCVLLRAAL